MSNQSSRTVDLATIKVAIESLDLIPLIEQGFVAYSNGQSVVPPVGELQLDKGEVHIKYGFIRSNPFYVIKIASGFYENSKLGLPSSNGCMLVFCQSTGQLKFVFLDEGHLTDIRTAVAGAIAAKYLAPAKVSRIGIVGTGIQARLQLNYLRSVTDCRDVLVWGRSDVGVQRFLRQVHDFPGSQGDPFKIEVAADLESLQRQCNLIVTTTPSCQPLLSGRHLQPGTHVTAVGSDTPEKRELDDRVLASADVVVADSIQQCKVRGEISQALRSGALQPGSVIELGEIISGNKPGRVDDKQITIADLTGVAVQDIQIATAVVNAL